MKKTIRSLISLIMVFVMSYNAFAVALSDNDGSAFITKSEFDSLKTNFQMQLDSYNTNIDNKIDNAIASYLAGIKTIKEPINYWDNVVNATGGNLWWLNTVNAGVGDLTPQVVVNATRELFERYRRPGSYGFWCSGGTNNVGVRHFVNATTNSGTDTRQADFNVSIGGRTDQASASWNDKGYTAPTEDKIYYLTANESSDGSGQRWEIHRNPAGYDIIRNYYTSFYPILIYEVWDHVWFNNSSSKYDSCFTQGGKSYKTEGSGTAPTLTKWGELDNGVTKTTGNVTSSANYIKTTALLNKVSDRIDYSLFLFAGGVQNNYIYCSYDDANPYVLTDEKTVEIPKGTFNDFYHTTVKEAVQNNEIYGYKLKYKEYNVVYSSKVISSFYNEYVSSATSEKTYVGQGCLIAKSTDDEEKEYDIKLKLKTNDGSGDIVYVISNKKFETDGSIASDNILVDGIAASGVENNITIRLKNKEGVYINLYADTSGKMATIESFDIKLK